MSGVKMTEQIKMQFGVLSRVCPGSMYNTLM